MIYQIKNSQVAQNACNHILDMPHDGTFAVVIEKKDKAKTIAQRNHFHSCVRVIANASGYSEREAKCLIVEKAIGLEEIVSKKTGAVIALLPSTEDLIKKHYTELIECVYEIAGVMELALPTVYD